MAQHSLADETILITGAAGSIGSIFSQNLCGKVRELILVDTAETPLHSLLLELNTTKTETKITYFIESVCQEEFVSHLFKQFKITTVIHAAAFKHVSMVEANVCAAINTNLYGAKLVLDASVRSGVDRFIFISTDKAVNPQSIMGRTKKAFEEYLLQAQDRVLGSKLSILRLCNVYGSSGSVVPLFQECIRRRQPLRIRGNGVRRAYVQPEELYKMLKVLLGENISGIYIPQNYELLTVEDVARSLLQSFALDFSNYPIQYESLFEAEKEHEELYSGSEEISEHPVGPLLHVFKIKTWKPDLSLLAACIEAAQNYKTEEAKSLLIDLTSG